MSNVDLVAAFLRGQNLEQLGRVDEAIELYESAVRAGFDSGGPYDRLIALYSHRARHSDVVRVAAAALESVHSHAEKVAWYREMQAAAEKAASDVPRAAPRRRP